MIKFQGEFSPQCKKWFIKREFTILFLCGLLTALIIGAGVVIFALLWHLSALYYLIVPFALPFILCVPCITKSVLKQMPAVVTINNGYIDYSNQKIYESRNLDLVKNIVDYGNWYCFNFYFPHKNICFICQKDLITEGTVEDFEKLFEGKIVKKVVKEK